MATLIFVDKDNEEPGSRLASKDGLKPGPGVKALDGKLQVSKPQVGKVFKAPALPKASRKALGMVNRATEKPVKTSRPLKQKQPTLTVKKITEKVAKMQGSVPASDDTYPDFESFDLPEEHQIAHLPLNGVPLMILNEESGLEKLPHLDPPLPLKMPLLPQESNPL
ncbi:securin-like [Onychomys torridus]|uniref:securin-like n=1 Tax=Onychomys torridus TaxID=38674 RepID=UPI00167F58EB|nr:securin-like [Onychomys torridus]